MHYVQKVSRIDTVNNDRISITSNESIGNSVLGGLDDALECARRVHDEQMQLLDVDKRVEFYPEYVSNE